jgi:hypothetical protein
MNAVYISRWIMIGGLATASVSAGNPPEIIVQAASPMSAQPTASPTPVAIAPPINMSDEALKVLKEMQAGDAEMLKKQELLMQQLEDIEKQVAEIKAYAHRS